MLIFYCTFHLFELMKTLMYSCLRPQVSDESEIPFEVWNLANLMFRRIEVREQGETHFKSHVMAQRTLERACINLKHCHSSMKDIWGPIGLFAPFIHQKQKAQIDITETMSCLISQYPCPPSPLPSPVASSNMPPPSY